LQVTPLRSETLKIDKSVGSKGAWILTLTGPLTLQTLFDFQQASREETAKPIVLDVTAVPYMDSAGLGSVLGMLASCQRIKRGFGLVGVTPRIRTLFQVTHVDGLLPCFDSLESAESAVMKSGA
jgi:anti-sigma B factor antagonist